ncbi:MAG: Superoxide dismutase [Fe] [Gammaproteobacteria bacterium]|nr:Superoxide dismutase [Fe] [Gammaproteobacteria bacterium]
MAIELPDLPYPYEALVPLISGTTLKTHHGRHHRAYVDNLNALVRGTDLADKPLEDIVRHAARRKASDPAMTAVFNNAAQAWNHAFYWRSLAPRTDRPPQGELARRLTADFGSQNAFAQALTSAATKHFASGWAWLVADRGALRILTTANADTPIVQGFVPLLVIDVWEHAYYLDYQADRARYVGGVVDHLLNWSFAEENYRRAAEGQSHGAAPARTGAL